MAADVQVRDNASVVQGSMVNAFPRGVPRDVVAADSIVEPKSFATRASEQFGDVFTELHSMQHYDRFADSFVTIILSRKNFVHDRLPPVPRS